LDGQIWALKADSLTSPLIVTVTVTVIPSRLTSRILNCTELKGHCLFVLVSGYMS